MQTEHLQARTQSLHQSRVVLPIASRLSSCVILTYFLLAAGLASQGEGNLHMPAADIDLTGPPRGYVEVAEIGYFTSSLGTEIHLGRGAFGQACIPSLLVSAFVMSSPAQRAALALRQCCALSMLLAPTCTAFLSFAYVASSTRWSVRRGNQDPDSTPGP